MRLKRRAHRRVTQASYPGRGTSRAIDVRTIDGTGPLFRPRVFVPEPAPIETFVDSGPVIVGTRRRTFPRSTGTNRSDGDAAAVRRFV
jgi:hypothetical protein